MGLSVSAAASIVIIGVLLIFGTLYPAIETSRELKNEARSDWLQRQDAKQRSDMTVTDIDHTEERLDIDLENTGDTALKLNELEVLINGVYKSEMISNWVVDEDITETDLWNPGQSLNITLQGIEDEVRRVVVVNEFGIEVYHSEVK